MSTPFIPIVNEPRTITRTVTETVTGFDIPPLGTPMRATLGNTVIEGTIHSQNFFNDGPKHPVIYLRIDGTASHHSVDVWLDDGWAFEILDGGVRS